MVPHAPAGWSARWMAQLSEDAEERSGQVLALAVRSGRLSAQVQGGAAAPYHVEVLVPVLSDDAWQRAVEVIAGQARHRAALHAGRLTDELVDDLAAADADPVDVGSVDARCPCRTSTQLCRHGTAVWSEAARRFADDPFALLQLRGRGRQQLLAGVAAVRRRVSDAVPDVVALETLDVARWRQAGDATAVHDEIVGATPVEPISGEAGMLRLLGDPPGWKGPADAAATFQPLVDAGARLALDILRGDADAATSTDEDEDGTARAESGAAPGP